MKGINAALIICELGLGDQVLLNIVVATETADRSNSIPYNEQVRLGQAMGRGGGPAPAPGSAVPQLGGSYNTGYPNRASIQQTGERFVIDNGYGERVEGVWENGRIFVGGVRTGALEPGCRIRWSPEGTVWTREPCDETRTADLSVAGKRCDVAGTWFYIGDRKARPSSIERRGDAFRVDNGQGSVSRGRLQQGELIADDWGVTGSFAENGCRINWSNGTWWRQYR